MYKVIFCGLFFVLIFTFCQNSTNYSSDKNQLNEIRGVSFVAMHYENKLEYLSKLNEFQFNWISQMPFAFQKMNDPEISFNHKKQWWGETSEGIKVTYEFSKQCQLNNLLKPQIWMGGEYTGKFTLENENDWRIWEKNYSDFILFFAHLADSTKMEAFCIGTELHQTVIKRTAFWENLIDTIRSFYDGKLTYAANWDEYAKVSFWKKLDWIGVNAYFPLSNEKEPSVKSLRNSWEKITPKLKQFSDSIGKPIVFTEIGYKSVDFCTKEPWNPQSKNLNLTAQKNAYDAFLNVFKNQSWFKGYFIWKWYPDHQNSGGNTNTDYSPQNKIAEKLFH